MKSCELCGAEAKDGAEECSRCGFVFQKEIRADSRDNAILKRHAGKSSDHVRRDMKAALAQLSALMEGMGSEGLSGAELATLLDEALSLMQVPLTMGIEDRLSFDEREARLMLLAASMLERADLEFGTPVGTPGTYVRLSNALASLGQPDRAMVMIDKAMLLNPRDLDAIYSKAKMLFYAKRYAQARRCLEKILASGDREDAKCMIELIEQVSRG